MVKVVATKDGKSYVESFRSEQIGELYAKDLAENGADVTKFYKRVLSTEEGAKSLAKKKDGTYRQQVLPDYMSVEIVWVAEWEEKETSP